ncbi:MAG TPA: hypothetical protein VNO26_04975 [Candidatus Limnocylindria bacterium]|nr:hypothetical protein [Candidatus Limnocylindria bacterium]
MRHRSIARIGAVAVVLASALACQDAGPDERLQRIDERLRALEQSREAESTAPKRDDVAADLASLERRLAAVERRLDALEKGMAEAAAAGPAGDRLEQRRERRLRLRELTDTYRARLAEIRETHTDPAARQQAVREALEWYRQQRRAVLAGEDPALP